MRIRRVSQPMTTITITKARGELAELFNKVAYGKERLWISKHGKKIALVPVEDVEAIEAIENAIDLDLDRKAMSEPGRSIPLEELKRKLGL